MSPGSASSIRSSRCMHWWPRSTGTWSAWPTICCTGRPGRRSATAYLEDLFVSPAVRGHGLGRALIGAVEAVAREVNASRLYWLTHETNSQAQELYNKLAERARFVHYRKKLSNLEDHPCRHRKPLVQPLPASRRWYSTCLAPWWIGAVA